MIKKAFIAFLVSAIWLGSAGAGDCFDRYIATVRSVYDGDTVTLDIDLGLGIKLENQKARLLGIDAPELRGAERQAGMVAKTFVSNAISGKRVIAEIRSDKKDKYGRWLAVIYMEADSGIVNINELMVANGHAKAIKLMINEEKR